MNFLGNLTNCGFMVLASLLLLFTGAVMLYCMRRLSAVENALFDQGKILQTFILKSQNNPSPLAGSLANPLATKEAIKQCELNEAMGMNKIEVSDDESDGSDESDEDESDESQESDESDEMESNCSEENEVKLGGMKVEEENKGDIKIIELEAINDEEQKLQDISHKDLENLLDTKSTNSSVSEISILSVENKNMEKNEEDVPNLIKMELHKGNITRMKVGDLRALVVEKGLISNLEEINKMKKDGLIKLLQEK